MLPVPDVSARSLRPPAVRRSAAHTRRGAGVTVATLIAAAVCAPAAAAGAQMAGAGSEHAASGPHAGAHAGPAAPARARTLGRITWLTSAAPAARVPFLEGVALLHNFHYDEAAADFRRARAADPAFAVPYWAEALTYSAVFWGYESLDSSRAALARLGPTPAARLAHARTADERAFGAMVEAFYADTSLPERARAAADAGRRWAAAAVPGAEEPLAFAALAVMMQGYTTSAPASDSVLAEAAGYAQRLFGANPRHPGAAHYLIHAWDRPATAARALTAARAYDAIAPDAEHALHMPSHIYYQLGMWADMARSNERAWPASRVPDAHGTPQPGSPHSLAWLQYAYLQQGRRAEARALVDTARRLYPTGTFDAATAPDEAGAPALLAFRYGVDTGDWSLWPAAVDTVAARGDLVAGSGGRPASQRARTMGVARAYHEAVGALLARGDSAPVLAFRARLTARGDSTARRVRALVAQLDGLVAERRGDRAAAVAAYQQSADLSPGGGPSIPTMLDSRELLAAAQLAAGDARAAAASYDSALAAFPGRTALVAGRARARAATGRPAAAGR